MLCVRRYEPGDRDAVWSLHNRALHAAGAHAGEAWYQDLHAIEAVYLEAGGEFLVDLLGERLVAMGAVLRRGPELGEIKRMRVELDCQRRGYGRAVLTALEARAIELGIRRLTLDTSVGQLPAQALYRSFGYAVAGSGRFAGFDVLYYAKELTPDG